MAPFSETRSHPGYGQSRDRGRTAYRRHDPPAAAGSRAAPRRRSDGPIDAHAALHKAGAAASYRSRRHHRQMAEACPRRGGVQRDLDIGTAPEQLGLIEKRRAARYAVLAAEDHEAVGVGIREIEDIARVAAEARGAAAG